MASVLIAVFILVTATLSHGFPSGGPYYSCKTLKPGHNDELQTSTPPYAMSVSRATVEPGGRVSVTLSSKGSPFMGFMCAASENDDQSNKTVGQFYLTSSSSKVAHLQNCSGSTQNTAITHSTNEMKTSVGFDWSAPASAVIGSVYKMRCTFVQSFNVYWINSLVRITVVGTGGQNPNDINSRTPASVTAKSLIPPTSNGKINPNGNLYAATKPTTKTGTMNVQDYSVSEQTSKLVLQLLSEFDNAMKNQNATKGPAGVGIENHQLRVSDQRQQGTSEPININVNIKLSSSPDTKDNAVDAPTGPTFTGQVQNNIINILLFQNPNATASSPISTQSDGTHRQRV
ncbi:putative ferric-chelate reductase 1 [Biomphalaria glabrata]|uniref:Ferric-chelate reductase 1 n=2 Tax=Biomphalaria glabrata TaxID=6526 RepID=A0A9W3AF18_BIOGL|nr:putative ferric-chelate reductase 1 [Biomphalaria glabrata]XP_055885915.1 putative ferric-chelate reductase 1 [Biomphalaria glabrata]XP_055885916.1 putative ferric-chelate reductase 1 [Biomphalaria glabrata]KAI8754548.1 putative defense protein; partial [Biomphalaria glabrata]